MIEGNLYLYRNSKWETGRIYVGTGYLCGIAKAGSSDSGYLGYKGIRFL